MAVQRRMQLATPDIDREYEAGAVGEQYLGKAAGRCADVEADAILDLDSVALQRARQLDAAARDIGVRRLRAQRGVNWNSLGRLQHRPVIGHDQARFDRGLRARPAFEQPALDQQQVRALAGTGSAWFALGQVQPDAGARVMASRSAAIRTQVSKAVQVMPDVGGRMLWRHQRAAVLIEGMDHHQIVGQSEILDGQTLRIDQAPIARSHLGEFTYAIGIG